MRRAFVWLILLGVSAYAFGQSNSPDSQTLQNLLNELRGLRQDLRVSLNRTQTIQILLARFQMQEGVITRASDHLNDVRQKLLEARIRQKEITFELKRLEDSVSTVENATQQADLQDRIKHAKSETEIAGNMVQEQQTAEIQAAQQLREEQDKLNALEGQLDELVRSGSNSNPKDSAARP
jgi:chromosome segregation ATPase